MTSQTDYAASCRVSPGQWSSRRPEHPGRLLERCYLIPLNISQAQLSRELNISRRRVNEIVNGQRAISAETAIKLADFLNTSPMFWLEKQQLWELFEAGKRLRQEREV